jgi:hypothetical protein
MNYGMPTTLEGAYAMLLIGAVLLIAGLALSLPTRGRL